MPVATISAKGSVVIPPEIRKQYGLKKGDKVRIIDYGGHIVIVPTVENPIEKLFGMFKGGPSLTEDLLKERRWELEREECDLPPPRS
jgi:AbrB family looped-hinge helix DNA binding protein